MAVHTVAPVASCNRTTKRKLPIASSLSAARVLTARSAFLAKERFGLIFSRGAGARTAALSVRDKKNDWKEWLSGEEYVDAWSDDLEPLAYPPLDTASRHIVDLLDDMQMGVRRGIDRLTTARCNKIIENLSDTSLGGNKLSGRAQRADAILKRMDKFSDLDSRGMALKFELPCPNRDTFFMVLKLYAKTEGSKEIPLRAEEIVRRMKQLYDNGRNDLKLNTSVWNQVIAAWAECSDGEKAFHAATILGQIKDTADSSSYSHVIRACARSDFDDRSKKLGSEVALRIWKDMTKSNAGATSYTYTFFLQACGFILDAKRRDRIIEDVFVQCCGEGKVNMHVLHVFSSVASENLLRKYLGEYIDNYDYEIRSSKFVRLLPEAWTSDAASKNDWGW